jgi:hypothetical protein
VVVDARIAGRVRSAGVGDRLPREVVDRQVARRLAAAAVVVPGTAGIDAYAAELDRAADRFAAWDGRVLVLPPDGNDAHRLLVVDRYRQVFHVAEAPSVDGLPSVDELEEWFKLLATMCPECGVLDDPLGRGWTP